MKTIIVAFLTMLFSSNVICKCVYLVSELLVNKILHFLHAFTVISDLFASSLPSLPPPPAPKQDGIRNSEEVYLQRQRSYIKKKRPKGKISFAMEASPLLTVNGNNLIYGKPQSKTGYIMH